MPSTAKAIISSMSVKPRCLEHGLCGRSASGFCAKA
jgi:hypothetical protein